MAEEGALRHCTPALMVVVATFSTVLHQFKQSDTRYPQCFECLADRLMLRREPILLQMCSMCARMLAWLLQGVLCSLLMVPCLLSCPAGNEELAALAQLHGQVATGGPSPLKAALDGTFAARPGEERGRREV